MGQSLGGYVAQAFMDVYPGEAAGFVSIDSAPLKRKYYPTWEVKALRHTRGMYQAIPWALLKPCMTEREDGTRGVHDANFDGELLADRARAEALCHDFIAKRRVE